MSLPILNKGDELRFHGRDDDMCVSDGLIVTVDAVQSSDRGYEVSGLDASGDENEWHVNTDGTVDDCVDEEGDSTVTATLHKRGVSLNLTVGMSLVCSGVWEDGAEIDGWPAFVQSGPDGDGDFKIQLGPILEDKDYEGECCYVSPFGRGQDSSMNVTPVTGSSDGGGISHTHQIDKPMVALQAGQFVRVVTTSTNDNFGVSIHGLRGVVKDAWDTTAKIVRGVPTYWIEFTVSDDSLDGFFANIYGEATEFNSLRAVPLADFATAEAGSDTIKDAVRKLLQTAEAARNPLPEFVQELLDESRDDRAERRAVTQTAIERSETEYGHRLPDGDISPWHKDFGDFPHKAVRINGEMCEPVARKVVYYEWEDL